MEIVELDIYHDDFKKICRICLHSGELKPFLMESKLYHLFQKLIPTEPDLEEELPKHVCLTCTKELQNILNFFEKCKYSEKVLKSIIEKKNIKETNIRKLDQDVPKMCAENGVKEAFINLALENTNIKLGIDTIKLLPTVKIQIDSDSKLDAKVKNEHSYSKSILNAFVVTDKLYSCEYCNKTFKSLSDLEDHNTFPDKAIVINHCTAHGEQKRFSCGLCREIFINRHNLNEHFLISHIEEKEKTSGTRKSSRCEWSSANKDGLNEHFKNMHEQALQTVLPINNKNISDRSSINRDLYKKMYIESESLAKKSRKKPKQKLLKCTFCEWTSNCKSYLVEHFKKLHIKECAIPSEDDEVDLNDLKIKHLKCISCSFKDTNENLIQHYIKSHIGKQNRDKVNNYLCSICGKTFLKRSSQHLHMKIHTGEKDYACHICGYTCIAKGTLNRHLDIHKGTKYQCHICGKFLSQRNHLSKHILLCSKNPQKRIFSNETHACLICKRPFQTRSRLRRHELVHQTTKRSSQTKPNDAKEFQCNECGKRFNHKCNLERHCLMIHKGEKPFQCMVCQARFTAKNSLDCHLNIHSGNRPYQCSHCPKNFRQPATLWKHILMHTGERKYKCHVCQKTFQTGSHLKCHMKRHS